MWLLVENVLGKVIVNIKAKGRSMLTCPKRNKEARIAVTK